MTAALALLLACARDDAPPAHVATVESSVRACAPYAELPDAYGYCLGKYVVNLPAVEAVEELCPRAGAWEDACRAAWVDEQDRRRSPVDAETLLRACGGNDDCAFKILDTRFGGDVLDAVARCESHVADYLQDCVGHALHRWVVEGPPDDAEAARVLAGAPRHARLVADYVGMTEACYGTARCDPARRTPTDEACRSSREDYRSRRRQCPVR